MLCLWGVIAVGGVVAYYASQLPPIDELTVPKRPPNIAILASDGSLLANRGETGGRTVSHRRIAALPAQGLRRHRGPALLRPFRHRSVGIARAMYRNVNRGGVSQGGSTLTQQLAKNLFLTQERTASRKIQEAILALWLERNYTKDQILELYLNRVYFGAGAYGVEAAAQRYYGKSAAQRHAVRGGGAGRPRAGAVAAGAEPQPGRGAGARRTRHRGHGRARLHHARHDQDGARRARAKPVRAPGAGSVNYAADYVMDVLDDFVGTIESDIVVSTTIDPVAAGRGRAVARRRARRQGREVQRQPGRLRRHAAGRRPARRWSAAATTRRASSTAPPWPRRQPGSAFKPFVYLAAMEAGLTPDTVREDSPVNYKGWTPENYDHGLSRRRSPCATALALSLNTVAVKLGLEVGPEGGRADGAAARHHLAAAGQPVDRARHLRGDAARAGERLCGLRQWRQRASSRT